MHNRKSKVLHRGRTKTDQEISARRPCRAGILWIVSVFPVLCQYGLDMLGCVETASVQFAYLHQSFIQFRSVKNLVYGTVQIFAICMPLYLALCKYGASY